VSEHWEKKRSQWGGTSLNSLQPPFTHHKLAVDRLVTFVSQVPLRVEIEKYLDGRCSFVMIVWASAPVLLLEVTVV
jgi:hypothetical protein